MKKLILIALLATFGFSKEYYGCENRADLDNIKMITEIGGMTMMKYMTEKKCIETTRKWKDVKAQDDTAIQRCMTTGKCYWFLKD